MSRAHQGGHSINDELVDDRELSDASGDRFRHGDFVNELVELATSVRTPSNIALFAPWGSGKSGIANMLGERFRGLRRDVEFVKFDAFKYGELPLRRNFLIQLADAVHGKDSKAAKGLRDRLYIKEESTDLRFERSNFWRSLGIFGVVMLVVFLAACATAGAVLALVSWKGNKGFWDLAEAHGTDIIKLFSAPAAIIGGLFALVGKSLPVKRTVETPSTDEQFEDEFKQIVNDLGAGKRLVVFIDELDRCAPDKVVDVLDTVRTFLDVPNTIFIVAADQEALECALAKRLQQATPTNTTDPYYSSGGEYLGKVFHYQFELPPLQTARLTQYAIGLVEGKPGIWTKVSASHVMPVLIPTHVRSPRRVKTLINTFVLTYRMVEQRRAAGRLAAWTDERVLELAKLVCLRIEFPLFARELPASSRLLDLVLEQHLSPGGDPPSDVSDDVWALAAGFATGKLSPDNLVVDKPAAATAATAADGASNTSEDEPRPNADRAQAVGTAKATLVRQFLNYLQKTRDISVIGRDLLFLEGRHDVLGIDPALFDEIEAAALEQRYPEMIRLTDGQPDEVQSALVKALAQITREGQPGIEGSNLVAGLLSLASTRSEAVLEACADEAFTALTSQRTASELRGDDLSGALQLALRTKVPTAKELVASVLNRDELTVDPELALLAVRNSERLAGDFAGRLHASIAMLATGSDAAALAQPLTECSEALATELLQGSAPLITSLLDDSATDAEQSRAAVLGLDNAIEGFYGANKLALSVPLMIAGFESSNKEAWPVAGTRLEQLQGLPKRLMEVTFARVPDVTLKRATQWLAAFPEAADFTDSEAAITTYLVALWDRRAELGADYDTHDTTFVDVLALLAKVQHSGAEQDRDELAEAIVGEMPGLGRSSAQAEAAAAEYWRARRFVEAGVVAGRPVANEALSRITERAEGPAPAIPRETQLIQEIIGDWTTWASTVGDAAAVTEMVTALKESQWLNELVRTNVALAASAAVHSPSKPYVVAEMKQLLVDYETEADDSIALWLREWANSPDDVTPLVDEYLRNGRYGRVRDDAAVALARLDPTERVSAFKRHIDVSTPQGLNGEYIADLDLSSADSDAVAAVLLEKFATTTNLPGRKTIIDAWQFWNPSDQRIRNSLITQVLLPTARTKEGLALVKSRAGLWVDPVGIKNRVRDELRDAAGGKDADKGLEKLLRDNRVVTVRSKGILRGSEEVDER